MDRESTDGGSLWLAYENSSFLMGELASIRQSLFQLFKFLEGGVRVYLFDRLVLPGSRFSGGLAGCADAGAGFDSCQKQADEKPINDYCRP